MPIRVLVAEDSPVVQIVLRRIFTGCDDIELVGMARTGKEALDLLPRVRPDVVCTDLHMPEMDGLELTEEIMATMPRPILVLSASVQAEDTQNVFRVLNAGAVDVLPKPIDSSVGNWDDLKHELLMKIRILSGVAVFTHRRRTTPAVRVPTITHEERQRAYQILAVGASTGGPQALLSILSTIPHNFPVPIVCVQHISRGFLQGLVAWLNSETTISVEIASAGAIARPGTAYFPPEDKHLIFDRAGRFGYSNLPPLSGHRPSVTVLFESVARCYGRRAVGVLLTGMGKDGAVGMLEIERSGGLTIAQDEASSVVFGMPKEAIALKAAHYVLPLNEISPLLLQRVFR
ncbi:chemotaxis response regulator protein-glutamate methylesterase [Leptolyngbya valderiana BDU 20041]|nr:chemotaxis-specific protein-glutamate methyltransferase CheB [Geitlerinema sp. CS-897]OAB62284.1 chemotaxis response regulator protein-glutamate methylesterase [Leptolyngbya valderiana BDU 20041]PPT10274.1 Chemotaxis response regulator protein-glutamate methylesterase CheB [Geitlerinema sp. FC II]